MFNRGYDFSHLLNIFSFVVRKGKRVLIVDFRNDNWDGSLDSVYEVEDGLYRLSLGGVLSSRNYNNFFGLEGFRSIGEGYDMVVFEVGWNANLLEMNALNLSCEVMVFHTLGRDEFFEVSSFLKSFNELYGRNLLISNVIPIYINALDENLYSDMVLDYSSYFISYPLSVKKDREYGRALRGICESIEYSWSIFDPEMEDFSSSFSKQKEYERFLNKASGN